MNVFRIDKTFIRSNANYKPPRYRPPYWYMPKERVVRKTLILLKKPIGKSDYNYHIFVDKCDSPIL